MKKKLLLIIPLLIIFLSKNAISTSEIPLSENSNLGRLSISLRQNFNFSIPLLKYTDIKGNVAYYDVGFRFISSNNKLLFEATQPIELDASGIETLSLNNVVILNQDFSFNIPLLSYVDNNSLHFYSVDFILSPINNKLIFEVASVIELQIPKENTAHCGDFACIVDLAEVIDSAVELAEATLESIRNGENKNAVLDLFQATKIMAEKIEYADTYSLRELALDRLKKARNAFEQGEIELAEKHMKETVEGFNSLKDKFINI